MALTKLEKFMQKMIELEQVIVDPVNPNACAYKTEEIPESLSTFIEEMAELGKSSWEDDPNACKHESCTPEFDPELAKGLSSSEVQRKFPRFDGVCPDCQGLVIVYASAAHYILGDW